MKVTTISEHVIKGYTIQLTPEEAEAIAHVSCLPDSDCSVKGGVEYVKKVLVDLSKHLFAVGVGG